MDHTRVTREKNISHDNKLCIEQAHIGVSHLLEEFSDGQLHDDTTVWGKYLKKLETDVLTGPISTAWSPSFLPITTKTYSTAELLINLTNVYGDREMCQIINPSHPSAEEARDVTRQYHGDAVADSTSRWIYIDSSQLINILRRQLTKDEFDLSALQKIQAGATLIMTFIRSLPVATGVDLRWAFTYRHSLGKVNPEDGDGDDSGYDDDGNDNDIATGQMAQLLQSHDSMAYVWALASAMYASWNFRNSPEFYKFTGLECVSTEESGDLPPFPYLQTVRSRWGPGYRSSSSKRPSRRRNYPGVQKAGN